MIIRGQCALLSLLAIEILASWVGVFYLTLFGDSWSFCSFPLMPAVEVLNYLLAEK